MGISLLRYRPWQGQLRSPHASPWPIARIGLRMMFRRKLFWALYVVALLNFTVFFGGIYLLSQLDEIISEITPGGAGAVDPRLAPSAALGDRPASDPRGSPGGGPTPRTGNPGPDAVGLRPGGIASGLAWNLRGQGAAGLDRRMLSKLEEQQRRNRQYLQLARTLRNWFLSSGTATTFRNFFWYQGNIVMAVLALAGTVLVGNDFRHGSLPFYLSKPVGRWHYLAGKFLAVGLFINMMTTLPCLVLYLQCGLLFEEGYFIDEFRLFAGILGYGAILTVCMGLLVVATACWLRKTIPMIIVWVGLLVFLPFLAFILVDRLYMDESWRLVDVWNNMYILGCECLGTSPKLSRGQRQLQPDPWAAAAVLVVVCGLCLTYLSRRIQAVEVVE